MDDNVMNHLLKIYCTKNSVNHLAHFQLNESANMVGGDVEMMPVTANGYRGSAGIERLEENAEWMQPSTSLEPTPFAHILVIVIVHEIRNLYNLLFILRTCVDTVS